MRFLLIAMSIIGSAHGYVWLRLLHDPAWPSSWFWLGTALLTIAWLSLPFTLSASRRLAPPLATLVAWPGYAWLGAIFLFFVAVAAVDAVRAALALWGWAGGGQVLAGVAASGGGAEASRVWAAVAASLGGAAVLSSLWQGRRVVVRKVAVPLDGLPAALDGTTIVQLSDIHIGPTIGRRFLSRVVDRVNALRPDVVVITGDLVDGSVPRLAAHVAPLARLEARHGVYFVTGNHEYYAGVDEWCAHLRTLGVRVLRNERVEIGEGADTYYLAGVDDLAGRHFGRGQGPDLARALGGREEARPVVLLAHQPRMIVEAERAGVAFQVSGHTHGGQIWPFHFLVRLQQPVTAGLQRFGRSLIYVSRGTGYWGPPMRLGSPAEITELMLTAPPAQAAAGVQ